MHREVKYAVATKFIILCLFNLLLSFSSNPIYAQSIDQRIIDSYKPKKRIYDDENYNKHPNPQGEENLNQQSPLSDSEAAQDPANYQQFLTPQQKLCLSLEKQLAQGWISRNKSRGNLPKINEELKKWDEKFNKAQAKADRADCYESAFIFGRVLKESRKCLRLHKKIEEARGKLEVLQRQKTSVLSNNNGDEDYLISQLARNECGDHYQKEDRRRNKPLFSFFDGPDYEEEDRAKSPETKQIMPFATYRTMCVRKCDGFYYPISFSTLPSRFPKDEAACQSKCAAPAELYVYRNPGEQIENMTSLNGKPYSDFTNAYRFKKEYIKGCSCKKTEYSPEDIELKEKNNKPKELSKSSKPSDNSLITKGK